MTSFQVPLELQEEAESEAAKRLELSKKKRVKELMKDGIAADPEEAAQKVLEETQEKQRIEKELDDPVDCDGVADLGKESNFEKEGEREDLLLYLTEEKE